MGRKRKGSGTYLQTLRDYTSTATVHGLNYIGDKSLPLIDRILWCVVLIILGSCVASFSYQVFKEWRSNKVVTVLRETELPITKLDFPAITICSEGLNMDAVEEAIENDYNEWKRTKRTKRNIDQEVEIVEFLKSQYGIKNGESILEIVAGMVSDYPDESFGNKEIRKVTDHKDKIKSQNLVTIHTPLSFGFPAKTSFGGPNGCLSTNNNCQAQL